MINADVKGYKRLGFTGMIEKNISLTKEEKNLVRKEKTLNAIAATVFFVVTIICAHLQEYYELQEPCLVTKCYDASDK